MLFLPWLLLRSLQAGSFEYPGSLVAGASSQSLVVFLCVLLLALPTLPWFFAAVARFQGSGEGLPSGHHLSNSPEPLLAPAAVAARGSSQPRAPTVRPCSTR